MTALHRSAISEMPDSLLADCVLNMGKRGSGKSSTFRLAMERALTKRVRCGWVDAMGIGWGIAVDGTGKTAGYPGVVVFGGEHGHLPISEGAGKALGTTLAKSSFSWVLDLKALKSKAARVRFMADFVEAIYEHCDEPLLLFMDEVDLWAPQMIFDKQGPAAQLLGAMHELVRRGRVKGLSVWMATQRPAEVSKGIISQADALFTFKLMAPQDLDAAMSWMKGHIGKEAAAEWARQIPTLKKGEAIVYITEPDVKVSQVQFPMIHTLDTFSPPKKGQAAPSDKAMAKIDLDAIGAQIKVIENELAATDPKALNARIKELEKSLTTTSQALAKAKVQAETIVFDPNAEEEARQDGYGTGYQEGFQTGWVEGWRRGSISAYADVRDSVISLCDQPAKLPPQAPADFPIPGVGKPPFHQRKAAASPHKPSPVLGVPRPRKQAPASPLSPPVTIGGGDLTGPERKIITALGEWRTMGFDRPSRTQVAALCDYHPRTPNFTNILGSLKTAGKIDHGNGAVWLTTDGARYLPVGGLITVDELHDKLRAIMDGPQKKIFEALLPHETAHVTRQDLADAVGYHPRTPHFTNQLGALRSREIIDYGRGTVFLRPWVFME